MAMIRIINGDDFGYGSNANAAIVKSFKEGWLSSASIMANMPGFDEACDLIHEHKLNDRVGLHGVLTEGVPLTRKIRKLERFCNADGEFRITRASRIFHLAAVEKEGVQEEIRAQIERCREKGLKLAHIDMHHHIHEEIGIISLVVPVMREFGIPHIRIMGNTSKCCNLRRRFYAMQYNHYLKYKKINRSHYFGSADQYLVFASGLNGGSEKEIFEIMTHPVINSEGVIIDAGNRKPMSQLFEEVECFS
ncbi:MAG: ChbG/HpnK family deacetylase [Nitrospiraceae bacterium]|nr:ChbG/HpnK family deacetylase [Nitrospiraceae bacterium]